MVRPFALLVMFLALLLAGCTGGPEDRGARGDEGGPDGADGEDDPVAAWSLDAPILEPGRSWTYATGGFWDSPAEVTIVVGRADDSGILLAAGAQEHLLNEVAWDLPYFGEFSRDFAPKEGPHGEYRGRLLAFPIVENATWPFWSANLTARAAEVEVLGANVPGARIEGEAGGLRVLVEYAPSVGFVTRYEETWSSGVAWSLRFTATRNVSEAWWLERGDEVFVGGVADRPAQWDPAAGEIHSSPPAELLVSSSDAEVLVWWLGTPGSKGAVAPPAGGPEPVTFDGTGDRAFVIERIPAFAGPWRLTGLAGDAEGWAYLQGHALRWIGPGLDLLGNA